MSRHEEIGQLLLLLDEAYSRHSWHGPNLKGALRGVSLEAAALRPGNGRHNIWELVTHAAYWKYVARRRLTGERRATFPLKGSNWFVRPTPDLPGERLWRADLALLASEHRSLVDVVSSFSGSFGPPQLRIVRGVIAHDIYHAGQIQLLKRLAG